MASGFRRSVSLPGPNPRPRLPSDKAPYHVRSASMPCSSQSLVSQLEGEVRATRAWLASDPEGQHRPSAWLLSGLNGLELLHLALDDLLQLPQTRESLRRSRGCARGPAETLLDDFLLFADAFGSFRSVLVSLQELQSASQVAIRMRNGARLSSLSRSIRKAEKELAGLSSLIRIGSKSAEPAPLAAPSFLDAEFVGLLGEVKAVTVSATAAVFLGVTAAVASATADAVRRSPSWTALRSRLGLTSSTKKRRCTEEPEDGEQRARCASERLRGLEECLTGLEGECERVFRTLVNIRVSLLNILAP